MSTLITSCLAMAGLMTIMAVGVIFQGKRLKGSCGGVGTDPSNCFCLKTGKVCSKKAVPATDSPPC